jgi:hypothetical protein
MPLWLYPVKQGVRYRERESSLGRTSKTVTHTLFALAIFHV